MHQARPTHSWGGCPPSPLPYRVLHVPHMVTAFTIPCSANHNCAIPCVTISMKPCFLSLSHSQAIFNSCKCQPSTLHESACYCTQGPVHYQGMYQNHRTYGIRGLIPCFFVCMLVGVHSNVHYPGGMRFGPTQWCRPQLSLFYWRGKYCFVWQTSLMCA